MDPSASPQCANIAPTLAYHETSLTTILTLAGFLVLLNVLHDVVDKLLHAGILAQLVLGAVFGAPLTNILPMDVQSAVQALGYLGLLLLVVEGGMTTRLDILSSPKTFFLSLAVGSTGILAPIVLSMALLPFAYHFTYLEAFVVGASLSSTSLGITLSIISDKATLPTIPTTPDDKDAAKKLTENATMSTAQSAMQSEASSVNAIEMGQAGQQVAEQHPEEVIASGILNTQIGTILIGAAVLDDIVALVLSSVIASLGAILEGGNSGALTPWTVVRPILSSALLLIVTITLARFVVKPAAPWLARQCRRIRYRRSARWMDDFWPHTGMLFWVAVLCAFVSIADVIDSTNLIGAFCVGGFTVHAYRSIRLASAEEQDVNALDPSTGYETIKVIQERVLSPFFFASIGFAIPVRDMFQGVTVWQGVLYAGLMAIAKVMACLPFLFVGRFGADVSRLAKRATEPLRRRLGRASATAAASTTPPSRRNAGSRLWPPAVFLGFALVTRGEIGFLIINIGQQVGILSCSAASPTALTAFNVGIWAIVLNTFVGPIVIGILLNAKGLLEEIEQGPWGVVGR